MKFDYFVKIENDLVSIIEDYKILITTQNIANKETLDFVNFIYLIKKEGKIENFRNFIQNNLNKENFDILSTFINEEMDNLTNFMKHIEENTKETNKPKLIKIDWRFIAMSDINDDENENFVPKILLNLIFNDGTQKTVETDFANFKKLSEDIESNLNSFNSTYSRRIKKFAK